MTTKILPFTAGDNFELNNFFDEIREALGNVSFKELTKWGLGCGRLFKNGLLRRGVGLTQLGKKIATTTLE